MPTAMKGIGLSRSYIPRALPLISIVLLGGCFDGDSDSGPAPSAEVSSAPPAPPPPETTTPPPETPPTPPDTNRPPEISGVPAQSVQAGQAYSFTPTASDADEDALAFNAVNLPAWAHFSTATGALTGTPGDADVGQTPDITINVTDGFDSRSIGPFRIHIHARDAPPPPSNAAPTISGSPAAAVSVNRTYSFTPAAGDADGDSLSFSISNRPSWASFSTRTGRLSGVPAAAATYSNIVISVSDGRMSASLPAFAIQVRGAENRAPTISGAPPGAVTAGLAYSFRPSGSDPDGDALTYSIQNRPSWASFDAGAGRLYGTPSSADAGSYANIAISVSDGVASASLPPFSIMVLQPSTGSATLTWAAPALNTDGSALTDLAGFRIRYGTSSSALNEVIDIPTPGVATYVVSSLQSGTWYFALEAYNESGVTSSRSQVASKTIP